MELQSQRTYAKHARVSHPTVRHWIARGMPHVEGKIEPETADAWRAANLGAVISVVERPKPQIPAPVEAPPASGEPPAEETKPVARPDGLTQARTEREQLRVQREQIRLEQDRGELVPAGEVEATWAALVVATQNAMLNVAEKVAGRVARSRDESECRSIVDREIREALAVLSHKLMEMAA